MNASIDKEPNNEPTNKSTSVAVISPKEASSTPQELHTMLVTAKEQVSLMKASEISVKSAILLPRAAAAQVEEESSQAIVVISSSCCNSLPVSNETSAPRIPNREEEKMETSLRPELISAPTQATNQPRLSLFIKSNRMPSDFFHLARKFLIKEQEMDLIAMETAIIVAVDTAHLLERSQYATICR